MSDFWMGVFVALAIVAVAAGILFVVLRRWFERASQRAADQMGRVLGELSGRAAATHVGRRTGPAAPPSVGRRFTNFGAYAASAGMTEEQARREFADSIERIARVMDAAVHIPIVGPVGLDALLGLVPVVGDAASALVALSLIARSIKYGVPPEIIARMLANVLIDLLMGSLPVAGDLADIWFRANMRNIALLREYLGEESRSTIDITATRVS